MAEQTPPSIPVVLLTRRLAETPPIFLGEVMVAALLSDVLDDLGHEPLSEDWLRALDPARAGEPGQRAWQRAAGLVAWLLADPAIGPHVPTLALLRLLGGDLHALVAHIQVSVLVAEDDRREELARLLLRAAEIQPAGETPAQSADRLATLDTASRVQVIEQARAAEAHAREVREALARRRAEEAAAKVMRE